MCRKQILLELYFMMNKIHIKIIYKIIIPNSYVILILYVILLTQEYKRKHIESEDPKPTFKNQELQSKIKIN